jgi:hypothetical protein
MMAVKSKPKQASIKIDREDYDRIAQEAEANTRSMAHQLRVIFREYFKAVSA